MTLYLSQVLGRPVDAFERRENELLLGQDVLDRQIVDITKGRRIYVGDVALAPDGQHWQASGLDVSFGAVLRHLGLGGLATRVPPDLLAWCQVQFLASQAPGARLQLAYNRLAQFHPMDTPGQVARTIAHYSLSALPLLADADKLWGGTVDAALETLLPQNGKTRLPRIFS